MFLDSEVRLVIAFALVNVVVAWKARGQNTFLQAQVQPFAGQSPASGARIPSDACHGDQVFERTLDRFAHSLFIDQFPSAVLGVHASQVYDVAAMVKSNLPQEDLHLADAKIATTRLQSWMDAVRRVGKTDYVAKAASGKNMSLPSNELGFDGNAKSPSNHGIVQSRPTSESVLNFGTKPKSDVPPACPNYVPADDPYWSLEDSYWIKNNDGSSYPYNVCKYSDNCNKKFTNRERVDSLRALLGATHKLLKFFDVTYMLFGGSVIGAYRCKDVLPWDLDTDVAVLYDDIHTLVGLLTDAPVPSSHWQGHRGRELDLAKLGLPGFTLMEKFPGCLPVMVVDKSTGFFTDMFPMKRASVHQMFSPWSLGSVRCDGLNMFGCRVWKCDSWQYEYTVPTSVCEINGQEQACARNLSIFINHYYGPGADTPDVATRGKPK
jgi:hypothetical protein